MRVLWEQILRTPEKNRKHVKKFRKKMQDFVREMKESQPCTDCSVEYPYYVMEFDHVRGKKCFGLATVSSSFVSKQRVLDEIAKCELVCSNCHAVRTWKRRQRKK